VLKYLLSHFFYEGLQPLITTIKHDGFETRDLPKENVDCIAP
jgi:hypothetical protein